MTSIAKQTCIRDVPFDAKINAVFIRYIELWTGRE